MEGTSAAKAAPTLAHFTAAVKPLRHPKARKSSSFPGSVRELTVRAECIGRKSGERSVCRELFLSAGNG